MTKDKAIRAAQSIDERINFAERARPVSGGAFVYLLGRCYTTRSGQASAEILGIGADWGLALDDLQARTGR